MNSAVPPGYVCPTCGANIGSRLAADGTYEPSACWRCLDRQRSQKLRAMRTEAATKLDLDIPAVVRQMKALPVFKDCDRPIARTKVNVIYTAVAYGANANNRRVRIRISRSTTLDWVLETLLHELCHAALPRGVHHNERFRRVLSRGAKEMWGIDVDPNIKTPDGKQRLYHQDRVIQQELKAKLDAGMAYPKKAASPVVDMAAARDKLIERRATHAAAMLARAERKLKLARTIAAKWRKKVNRYEKIAARKGKP